MGVLTSDISWMFAVALHIDGGHEVRLCGMGIGTVQCLLLGTAVLLAKRMRSYPVVSSTTHWL